MKKIFIFIFLIVGNILWGQDLLNKTVKNGDISLLDKLITIDQLLNFNKNDLRIIRNTIFAKYGLKFNSIDLQNHFSQFQWYNGVKANVDNELTSIDKKNIELIQNIEKNYPVNNEIVKELTGNWYKFGAVADQGIDNITELKGNDRVQILTNGIYIYYAQFNIRLKGILYGLWSFKNNYFETVPIGEHLVYLNSPSNNIGEYVKYNSQTYGKINYSNLTTMEFNDNSKHIVFALFNDGGWAKE
jgi:hypothetical protein